MANEKWFHDHEGEGLGEADLRLVTATLYTRFRGLFTGVTREAPSDGPVSVVVWDCSVPEAKPLFKISRWDGRYAARGKAIDPVLEEPKLERLLDKVRKCYPASPPV